MEKCVFDMGDKCKAMTKKKCLCCHFQKTAEELEAGREKAAKKVSQLEPALQEYIRHKYYGGRRAFRDE